jgi:hypothetical protein
VCAFLIADPDRQSVIPASTVARLAGRDDSLVVRQDLMTPESYRLAIGRLVSVGWTATLVSPFYTLYEPPGQPLGSASGREIWAGRSGEHRGIFSDGFEEPELSSWTVPND